MKFLKARWLAAGALASGLMFAGCSANSSSVRESPYADNTGMGFGHISKTKQSDDNLRMPLEDPLRTRQQENIRAAEADANIEESNTGIGGAGQSEQAVSPRCVE